MATLARVDAPLRDLSAEKQQLAEQGFCVVPGVIDAARTAEVLERLHRAAQASERMGVSTFMPILDPNASNVRVFYLLEHDAVFRELIGHPLAVDLVQSLLGEEFLISNFTANIARPGAGSMFLHSDQSLVVPEPWLEPWAINIIWCLSDVRFENGGTLHIKGSHRWTKRSEIPANAAEMLESFVAPAGSIVAMDGRMWHTSGANITKDEERPLLFGYYTKPFLRPQVNWNAALSPETQNALSEQMQIWLGLGVTANTGIAETHVNRLAAPQEDKA
ncbi:phytanoyl-CoA dioxygenase family protein [Novosphingobium sp. KCTC 2891]|uniref:phytanoyl-CoA dioxygenase family protein n=1 Tax=Novosphingobium sp. KCTC 2891 TaxID=2989730 RepID=UPI0022227002|nr:phytanoyl-CoA dioxygenase family protein [Novosphingobium sp. KCTC 2891]MCW1381650.1 phytanoyl-CoA dioxygenase family protein [Novosphingobium sp. KCTC 2891]